MEEKAKNIRVYNALIFIYQRHLMSLMGDPLRWVKEGHNVAFRKWAAKEAARRTINKKSWA